MCCSRHPTRPSLWLRCAWCFAEKACPSPTCLDRVNECFLCGADTAEPPAVVHSAEGVGNTFMRAGGGVSREGVNQGKERQLSRASLPCPGKGSQVDDDMKKRSPVRTRKLSGAPPRRVCLG